MAHPFFTETHRAAFHPSKHAADTTAVNAERRAVSDRFLDLHRDVLPAIKARKWDLHPHHMRQHTTSSWHLVPGYVSTIVAMWLPYGREKKCFDVFPKLRGEDEEQEFFNHAKITAGPLRHVPYVSLRAGRYELNVYGDPERPACVEAGVAPGAPVQTTDMEECRALLASGLSDQEDARLVGSMPLGEETTRQRGGLAFEVTLPDAPDSHGYWWISLYSAEALDEARLHEAQLADMVVHESALSSDAGTDPHSWSRTDVRSSGRRLVGGQAAAGGRTVYVRGYTRRDGTYVQPHTRSSPGTGGGRRGGGRR